MQQQGLNLQNIITVIWDFDRTLASQYMQTPLFEEYKLDEKAFWDEVNALPAYYAKAGIQLHPDTCYLGHLLTYVKTGKMKGLSNAKLRELGGRIPFFPGVPAIFDALQQILSAPQYLEGSLRLEHYVVSTGLKEMIRGSAINEKLSGIWASEFIETPAAPGYDFQGAPTPGEIAQIAGFLDNTTKTRALFEINKGVNKGTKSVNDMVPEEDRRVPFSNMIYIADGPSDIPSFSVVKKHGGKSYAVYDPASARQFAQAVELQENGRVDGCGPANYKPDSQTYLWLELQVTRIADRILADRQRATQSRIGAGPDHIQED